MFEGLSLYWKQTFAFILWRAIATKWKMKNL